MIKVNVKFDIDRMRRDLSHMRKEVNRGAIVALTRVATTARKEADQEIRQRLALKSGTVKEAVTITKYRNVLVVDIDASGKPIALRDWSARETRKGVTFLVAKGRKRKVYMRKGQPGFIVPKFGSHVFVRKSPEPPGPTKAKIGKVYGPSIPQYFVTKVVTGRMQRVVQTRWPIEFERQMKYRMAKASGSL